MTERIMAFLSGCCVPFLVWLLLSWADVVANNMDGAIHAWNLFMLMTR